MSNVTPFPSRPAGAGKVDATLIGATAECIRKFLRSCSYWEAGYPSGPDALADGRALIEDFALRAVALRENEDAALYGQEISLAEVALVLGFLSQATAKADHNCFRCGGDGADFGYGFVLDWLQTNVERHAGIAGENDDPTAA